MQEPSRILGVTGDHKLGITIMSCQCKIQRIYQGMFVPPLIVL